MAADDILLNLTYVAFVAAPLLRDELRLRIALAVSSVGFALWAWMIASPWTIVWNLVFIAISIRTIVKVMRERRPMELDADCEQVRQRLFPEMTTRQFSRFWELGEDHRAVNEQLAVRGEPLDWFWVLQDGDLEIDLTDGSVKMDPCSTIGGISYVMGDDVAATASVYAHDAHLRRWSKATLRNLERTDAELNAPFLSGVGRGLVSKIRS